jgi:hypothetical protein
MANPQLLGLKNSIIHLLINNDKKKIGSLVIFTKFAETFKKIINYGKRINRVLHEDQEKGVHA